MKKLIALLLTLAFILSLSCTALAENKLEKILSIGEITFATSPDFAPSEFINPNATGDDQYVGADVELAKYIAQGLGVKLVIMPMEFGALQAAITQARIRLYLLFTRFMSNPPFSFLTHGTGRRKTPRKRKW